MSTPHATEAHRYANRWAAVASFGAFVVLALFSNIYYPVQRLAIFARPAPADGSIVSGVDDQGAAVFLADVDRFCCPDLTRDAWDAACGHGLANEIFDPMQWQEVQSRAGDCADGVTVVLNAPLGTRTVVDRSTGQTVEMSPAEKDVPPK